MPEIPYPQLFFQISLSNNKLKLMLVKHNHNESKLRGKYCGITKNALKIWYNTNTEKIILYGAGISGGKLTKKRTAIQ